VLLAGITTAADSHAPNYRGDTQEITTNGPYLDVPTDTSHDTEFGHQAINHCFLVGPADGIFERIVEGTAPCMSPE
jgi:hypothetical protein